MDTEEQPTSPQMQVIAGGTPTAEELAGLVVALAPAQAGDTGPRRPAPWRRGAMLEGIGARPPTSPADLGAATLRD